MVTANGMKPKVKAGFHPQPKRTATLKFVDGDYAGAVVECSLGATVAMYLKISAEVQGVDDLAALMRQFGRDLLLSWNITDAAGEPVPATGEGMLEIDIDFARAILGAWLSAVTEVPGPLDLPSSNGEANGALATQVPIA